MQLIRNILYTLVYEPLVLCIPFFISIMLWDIYIICINFIFFLNDKWIKMSLKEIQTIDGKMLAIFCMLLHTKWKKKKTIQLNLFNIWTFVISFKRIEWFLLLLSRESRTNRQKYETKKLLKTQLKGFTDVLTVAEHFDLTATAVKMKKISILFSTFRTILSCRN